MFKFISWLLAIPLSIIILTFSFANREAVTLSAWPLNNSFTLPLSLLVLGIFFLGVCIGSLTTWTQMLPYRFKAYHLEKKINKQEATQEKSAE